MATLAQTTPSLDAAFAAPGVDCFAITPSDTINFNRLARAIYVGVTGNVVIVTQNENVVAWVGCPAGFIIPCAAIRVNNTNTTASSLVGIV